MMATPTMTMLIVVIVHLIQSFREIVIAMIAATLRPVVGKISLAVAVLVVQTVTKVRCYSSITVLIIIVMMGTISVLAMNLVAVPAMAI